MPLAELLAAGVFEELGIRLAGDAGIRIGHLPNWLGWAGSIGRGAGGRVLPEPPVFEDLADDVALVGLDEGDDLHGAAAARAAQRGGLVDALDEHGPAPAIKAGRRRDGRLYLLGCGVPDLVWVESGVFGSHAAGLVGIAAVVADEVLALVGDVLDQFGEEVQRPEDLEVAGHATKEVRAGRLGEAQRALLFSAVDDLAGWADADHSGEAKRAPGHILGQASDALGAAGLETDTAVHAEAAVSPGSDLGDHGRLDPVLVQEQAKDLVLPESKERLMAEVLGQRAESAVGCEGPVGHQTVEVRVEMDELSEGPDGKDTAGGGVLAQQGAVNLEDRLPGEAGEPVEQVAVETEEDAEAFGDGPNELAMGHVEADVFGDVEAEQERAFLAATGANAALLAGKGDEELVAAVGAADPGKAVVEVAALEELVDGLVEHRPPVPELAGVAFAVDGAEVVEVLSDEAVEVRLQRLARAGPIDPTDLPETFHRSLLRSWLRTF